MWNSTRAAEVLGLTYPIVQGPFGGGLSSTVLAATVSNAGGMGSFGADNLGAKQIGDLVAELRLLTPKPFAVNLWVSHGMEPHLSDDEFDDAIDRLITFMGELDLDAPSRPEKFGQYYDVQVRALLEAKPPVFSFVYGVPEPSILAECRRRGIKTVGTATTAAEAVALDQAGVDCVVASGFEAGGHKGAFLKSVEDSLTGTFALVPHIVDRVKAPVIAAGGVGDSLGLKAALALGASGVQIGTAFLACEESGASPAYRELLFSEAREDTVLTSVFTGRLARSMRNRFSEEMAIHAPELPDYPVHAWFVAPIKAAAIAQGRTDLISLWAGQGAHLVRFRKAQELFDHLVSQMSAKAA